jgi:hypothetical protein
MRHDSEHNDEEQSYIEPLFSSRAGADPESESWYDFKGFWESEEDGASFPARRPIVHNATISTRDT